MSASDLPLAPPQDEPPPTSGYVRDKLLGGQERRGPAIRSTFLQKYGGQREPGPLSAFVRDRRLFALQLYLLLICVARKSPWDANLSASSWALALDRTNRSAESTVSRNWSWLSEQNLVETTRLNRRLKVTRRLEDGTDKEYQRPTGNYFILSSSHWTFSARAGTRSSNSLARWSY